MMAHTRDKCPTRSVFCCTHTWHGIGMGRGPGELRGDEEGPWPRGEMDAGAMGMGTMRETIARSDAGAIANDVMNAGVSDNGVIRKVGWPQMRWAWAR